MLLLGLYWGAIPTLSQRGRRKRKTNIVKWELRIGAAGLGSRREQAPQRGDLQLSEGHLAGILDDSCVGDSYKGGKRGANRSRRQRVWWGRLKEEGGRREGRAEAEEAEKVTASIDFSRQQRKVEPSPVEPALLQACPFAGRQFTASFTPISLPVALQIASLQMIPVDDAAAARLTAAFYVWLGMKEVG